MKCQKGDWVQIENVVLPAGQRATTVPEDTAKLPLIMRVNGFLQNDAEIGETVEILTLAERKLQGKLIEKEPAFTHNFGKPIKQLLEIGLETRAMLRKGGQ